MPRQSDVLISVHGRHADNMLSGQKTVELRKKAVRVMEGSRLWIYSKLPDGHIGVVAFVDAIVEGKPSEIWEKFGAQTGISHSEFDSYFKCSEIAYAILLHRIEPLSMTLNLSEIRKTAPAFQPPQFLKYLSPDSPELDLFETYLERAEKSITFHFR